jgi:MurNAc alpha-1-phosphate uridylyltransferase
MTGAGRPPIDTAMVLAAGLGTRMRPLTERLPKPLVEVAGRTLIDRCLDTLAASGVRRAVVNVHHLADLVVRHLASRRDIETVVSDERAELLDSAGGIIHALPLLGRHPFFVLNADTFWIDGPTPDLQRLALAWRPQEMDILLMLADPRKAHGHSGGGDFRLLADGRLARAPGEAGAPIYAGAAILDPRIFDGAQPARRSLNLHFDRAIARGRLFGLMMEGVWITVGTPGAIAEAERAISALQGA